jgi:hypothetical protein
VDITGGAPELSEFFRYFVEAAQTAGAQVVDRCNLTIISKSQTMRTWRIIWQIIGLKGSRPCPVIRGNTWRSSAALTCLRKASRH